MRQALRDSWLIRGKGKACSLPLAHSYHHNCVSDYGYGRFPAKPISHNLMTNDLGSLSTRLSGHALASASSSFVELDCVRLQLRTSLAGRLLPPMAASIERNKDALEGGLACRRAGVTCAVCMCVIVLVHEAHLGRFLAQKNWREGRRTQGVKTQSAVADWRESTI